MVKDILVEFYISTLKSQACEYRYLKLQDTDPIFTAAGQQIDCSRREYGASLFGLLRAVLPVASRHPRLFRMKYVDEVDLVNMENNIISTANKIMNYKSVQSLANYDLHSVQPTAAQFLDKLAEVQYLLSAVMDDAVAVVEQVAAKQTRKSCAEASQTKHCLSNEQDVDQSNQPSLDANNQSDTIDNNNNNNVVSLSPTASTSNQLGTDFSQRTTTRISSCTEYVALHGFQDSSTSSENHSAPHCYLCGRQQCHVVECDVLVDFAGLSNTILVKLPPICCLTISADLINCLSEVDNFAAQLEFEFIQCVTKRIRSMQEVEDLQLVTVLFSETMMWCLSVQLLTVEQLADRDPCVLLSLPRMAIFVGCRLLPDSPIGANRLAAAQRLPFMFASARHNLSYLCRQLHALRPDQLCRLVRWLGPRGLPNLIYNRSCTNSKDSPGGLNAADQSHSSSNTCGTENSQSQQQQQQQQCVWRTSLAGLHRLYKAISNVADYFAATYPTEFRFILQKVIEMYDTSYENTEDTQLDTTELDNNQDLSDAINSSDSVDDTESEWEINLDAGKLKEHSAKFEKMSNLFNWFEMVNAQNPSSPNLNQIFKNYQLNSEQHSSLSHSQCKQSEAKHEAALGSYLTNLSTSTSKLSNEKMRVSAVESDTRVIETGIDVVVAFSSDQSTMGHAIDQLVLNKEPKCTAQSFKQTTLTIIDSTLSQCLQLLKLGVSVESSNSPADRSMHYLPTWQPDELSPSSLWNMNIFKIESDVDDDDLGSSVGANEDTHHRFKIGQQCAHCCRQFSLIRRRHHCRRCGHIFCGRCANYWEPVEGLANNKPVRICTECYEFLDRETVAS